MVRHCKCLLMPIHVMTADNMPTHYLAQLPTEATGPADKYGDFALVASEASFDQFLDIWPNSVNLSHAGNSS